MSPGWGRPCGFTQLPARRLGALGGALERRAGVAVGPAQHLPGRARGPARRAVRGRDGRGPGSLRRRAGRDPSTPGTRAFLRLAGRTPGSADNPANVTGRGTSARGVAHPSQRCTAGGGIAPRSAGATAPHGVRRPAGCPPAPPARRTSSKSSHSKWWPRSSPSRCDGPSRRATTRNCAGVPPARRLVPRETGSRRVRRAIFGDALMYVAD
jgi:hypothetical protein